MLARLDWNPERRDRDNSSSDQTAALERYLKLLTICSGIVLVTAGLAATSLP